MKRELYRIVIPITIAFLFAFGAFVLIENPPFDYGTKDADETIKQWDFCNSYEDNDNRLNCLADYDLEEYSGLDRDQVYQELHDYYAKLILIMVVSFYIVLVGILSLILINKSFETGGQYPKTDFGNLFRRKKSPQGFDVLMDRVVALEEETNQLKKEMRAILLMKKAEENRRTPTYYTASKNPSLHEW